MGVYEPRRARRRGWRALTPLPALDPVCCLTRACSRRAGGVPGSARAQRPERTLRNERLCRRERDSPQLMRMSLGGRPTPAQAGRTHLPAGRRPDIRGHSETPVRPRGATNLWEGK
jgi:hypothetical protein